MVLDPNAIRPLVVGKMQDGTYILASETCAIDVLEQNMFKIFMREYVVINHNGIEVKSYTLTRDFSNGIYLLCASRFNNCWKNVHAVRKVSGKN